MTTSNPETTSELHDRRAAVLNAVVTEYISSAQPVGSQHVVGAPGVNVSSATVRSEMATLEREGYLVQPHTSAGRIPTDKGYRFFVDHLAEPGLLGPAQRQRVRRFFDLAHGEIEQMLERTSGLLADLTACTALVVGPSHETATVRSVQLVDLGPRLALVVAVLSDGAVEKRTLELSFEVTEETMAQVGAHLTSIFRGGPLGGRAPLVDSLGDQVADSLATAAAAALRDAAADRERSQVFLGGTSRMASAFDAVETVRSVLSILEQQMVVVTLLRDVLDRGLSVAIGAEHGFEPLASCAVVVVPVSVDGEEAGTVGLLGPTRMNYPQALAAVRVVGEQLGHRLGGAPFGAGHRGAARREGHADHGG